MRKRLGLTLFVAAYAVILFCWSATFVYVVPSPVNNWFSKLVSIGVGTLGVIPAVGYAVLWILYGRKRRTQLIVIAGAPGTGKSTLAETLRSHFGAPWIDFGRLREFHLKRDWSNQSPFEMEMTFENLVSIVGNYARHGYPRIIVDDLRDDMVQRIPDWIEAASACILTLTLSDDAELCRRIETRNDGWTDVEGALAWNRRVSQREPVRGEHRIDATGKSPGQVFDEAIKILGNGSGTS